MPEIAFKSFPTAEAADAEIARMKENGVPAESLSLLRIQDDLSMMAEPVDEGINPAQNDYPRSDDDIVPSLSSRPEVHGGGAIASADAATPSSEVAPGRNVGSRTYSEIATESDENKPVVPVSPMGQAAKRVGVGIGVGALAAGAALAVPGIGLVVGSGILATAVAALSKKAANEEDSRADVEQMFKDAGATHEEADRLAREWQDGATILRIEH